MATPAIRVWKQRALSRPAVILTAWIILGGVGCAYRQYRAPDLPAELVAPPTQKIEPALLSRLARHTAGNDVIGRGDLLSVAIDSGYGEESVKTSSVRVFEDATARIPDIGTIRLGGLTLQDAERAIAQAAVERNQLVNPYVSVTIESQRKNFVTVLGPVESQGVVALPRSSSYLLDALVAAGNLTEEAGPDIEIRRPARQNAPPTLFPPRPPSVAGGVEAQWTSFEQPSPQVPRTTRINLVSAAKAESRESYYLEDGDVVVVSERGPRSIYLMGLVNKSGAYDLPFDQDVRVLDALAMAEGRTSQLADKVLIVRQLAGQSKPSTIVTSVRKAKNTSAWNLRLAPGDVVSVEETPTTFMLDIMKNFVRFGVSGSVPLF